MYSFFYKASFHCTSEYGKTMLTNIEIHTSFETAHKAVLKNKYEAQEMSIHFESYDKHLEPLHSDLLWHSFKGDIKDYRYKERV